MQIKRLKLSGFKSFVDSTELRIEPGLTGIVGPNGCGKSNLLEAIRWVMGESSAKSMRGGGMEDVIFAGTATRPQRDFAEVSMLTIQEQGELFPSVDVGADGELEVMRRIERGAGSAYRANGRDVRAKDVSLIFADAATGAHSPALVSQGKIAAVIAARPQERRAMLEEAAGIAGLHVRRRDAEQKLRAAEANLARLADILGEMDGRANALRRQAKAAERYTLLSAQIRTAEARTIFGRWREAAALSDAAKIEAQAAESTVTTAQEAQLAAAVHMRAAVDTLTKLRADSQCARDSANEAGHRLTALKAERSAAALRLADLAAQAERLEEDRGRESALAYDATEALDRLAKEVAALKVRTVQTKEAAPQLAIRLAQAEVATRDAEVDLAHAMATQAGEQAELRIAEAAVVAAHGRLERAARDLRKIELELAALPETKPLERNRDDAMRHQAQAEKDRTRAEAALARAEIARETADAARATAGLAFSSMRAELAALDSEATVLSKSLGQGSGEARALNRVKAEPGYERALAAALGDDLEASVGTDGRRRWSGAEVQSDDPMTPGDGTRLSDHVTAPPELARRLAQIVVVQGDIGQKLAIGQRLVTFDGQMRRWDGFVAQEGGAEAAQRLIRLNRLEVIATTRPALAMQVEAAQAQVAKAEAEGRDAEAAFARARAALGDADQRMRAALRTMDESIVALERLSERRAELKTRLADLLQDHANALADHGSATKARENIPDGMATRTLIAALSQARDGARVAVNQAQSEIAMAERTIASDRERMSTVEADMRGWRLRAGEATKRIAAMADRSDAIAAGQKILIGKPEALNVEIEALSAQAKILDVIATEAQQAERDAEGALRPAEALVQEAAENVSAAREARAGAVARAESAQEKRLEMGRLSGERFECPPPVLPERLGFDSRTIRLAQIEQAEQDRLMAERERLGPVNLVAAKELNELEADQARSRNESEELTHAINRLRGSIGSLNREGRQRLLAAFQAVDEHFRRLFTTLFNGGQAHLELIDSDDPLEAGLEIMAQPPGKKLSALTLLSGGEQALTAVALIFGLFLTNPAPICVLDEVDAPLDDANVDRFCDLLDRMVADTKTRYLIVTHNAVTMARMHRLFGVTMVEQGISRLVSVDLNGAEKLLAAE